MEGEENKTTPVKIEEEDQIVDVQFPPSDLDSENDPPTPPNSPTKIEDQTFAGKTRSLADLDDSEIESKIKDLEKRIKTMKAEESFLRCTLLCYQDMNEKIGEETARIRAVNEAYLNLREDEDADIEDLIQMEQWLEDHRGI